MQNVIIADSLVEKLKNLKAKFEVKQYMPLSHKEVEDIIKSLQRLAILERHLVNLTSNGYEEEK